MNPYITYTEVQPDTKVLNLFCGIGLGLDCCKSNNVTNVDICPEYINEVNKKYPHHINIVADVIYFLKSQPDKTYEVVYAIDGIEHLTKEEGYILLKEMERVGIKTLYLFTPENIEHEEGLTYNNPHITWGIPGGDIYQEHKSGWKLSELNTLGWILIGTNRELNVYDSSYYMERLYKKVL